MRDRSLQSHDVKSPRRRSCGDMEIREGLAGHRVVVRSFHGCAAQGAGLLSVQPFPRAVLLVSFVEYYFNSHEGAVCTYIHACAYRERR